MPTTPPSMTPTPTNLPQRGQRSTFSGFLDDFIAWLPTGVTDFGAVAANVWANTVEAFNSAISAAASATSASNSAATASATAGAVGWAAGVYALNAVAISPSKHVAYRKITASSSTSVDPANDPTNWLIVSLAGDHEVSVSGANGFGTTATQIRRFTTVVRNVGSAITYTDSSANGAKFTINEDGIYSMYTVDGGSVNNPVAVSVNSSTLTTGATTAAGVVCITIAGAAGRVSSTRTMRLVAGDVVRAHVNSTVAGSSETAFSISKVAQ